MSCFLTGEIVFAKKQDFEFLTNYAKDIARETEDMYPISICLRFRVGLCWLLKSRIPFWRILPTLCWHPRRCWMLPPGTNG